MISRRQLLRLCALAPLLRTAAGESSLYAQSLQAALARLNPGVELLLYDAPRSLVLASTFADPALPIPVGSLLKPFLAFAYLSRAHHPELGTLCHGRQDLCWKPGGHGVLNLPDALAQSCNAYFLALAAALSPDEITLPTRPPADATAADLIGLHPRWLLPPETLVAAYARLLPQTTWPILDGMRRSATEGTAQRIGNHPGGVLAKTGTATCIPMPTPCQASSDGLVFAAVPAQNPSLLLLVRRRATTGATTALTAGLILNQLERLHAL
jgi:cell division protein FtsI/penicillin-binding protein 2